MADAAVLLATLLRDLDRLMEQARAEPSLRAEGADAGHVATMERWLDGVRRASSASWAAYYAQWVCNEVGGVHNWLAPDMTQAVLDTTDRIRETSRQLRAAALAHRIEPADAALARWQAERGIAPRVEPERNPPGWDGQPVDLIRTTRYLVDGIARLDSLAPGERISLEQAYAALAASPGPRAVVERVDALLAVCDGISCWQGEGAPAHLAMTRRQVTGALAKVREAMDEGKDEHFAQNLARWQRDHDVTPG